MNYVVSATLFPFVLQTLSEAGQKKFKPFHNYLTNMATAIKNSNPQTILILSRGRFTPPDAIGINNLPYMRGNLDSIGLPTSKIGFDNDNILNREIKKTCSRMGIPLIDILETIPTVSQEDYLLHPTAVLPLYYLQQAGLSNKHLIRLSIGRLCYEELFTLGKIIHNSAVQTKRKIAIITTANLLPVRNVAHTKPNLDLNLLAMQALGDKQPSCLHELGYPPEDEFSFRSIAFLLGIVHKSELKPSIYHYETVENIGCGLMHYS